MIGISSHTVRIICKFLFVRWESNIKCQMVEHTYCTPTDVAIHHTQSNKGCSERATYNNIQWHV